MEVKASASQPRGHWFNPRPGYTKDLKNSTHCFLVWHLTFKNEVGKLNTRSYQWSTPPPAVAFIVSAGVWPKVIETGIGATLCAIGARRNFNFLTDFLFNNGIQELLA